MGKINTKILKQLITEFQMSETLKNMRAGQKYYEARHDILKKKLNEYTIYDQATKQQIKKVNENKSNQKVSHPFHQKQVNQKISYCCAKPITLKYNSSNNKNITDIVWNALGFNFEKLLKNRAKEASNKGRAWIHPNYKNGKLVFEKYRAEECIPIFDTETQTYLTGFIHFYTIQDLSGDEIKEKIYVEYWDEKEVTYYEEQETENGSIFIEDVTRPALGCHWTSTIYDATLNNVLRVEKHSWGKVPFIAVENNEECTTDLENIKGLIDAYDLIDSNFINTVEDLKEIIWLVNGYGAEDLLAYIEAIKVNGVARNNDVTGKIDAKTIPIPYEARKTLLDMLRSLIYEFGRAVDTANRDLIRQAPSGVSLEFLYSDLDQKADDLIVGLKTAVYEVLWYVLEDLKQQGKIDKSVNEFDFSIEFNKSRIFNEIEKANALSNDTVLSIRSKLEKHPWVDDVDVEYKQIQEEQQEKIKQQQKVFGTGGYKEEPKDGDLDE